ncbi:MAG: UDP-N-acetylmuramoyl-L-alanyl-D-glutamate--2,6-diaminopimelate ligase [Verrucomicrobiales bacterium]|nr:UDP-N-acetylmuramoyl-L-alanyl-D-glutamate--2,6-diaminopimelate ligase [Verrucomicrobiales bacterium]
MQLKQIIQKLHVATVVGPTGQEINGISYDVRAVQPGSLYVAMARETVDGHDSIDEAIGRGAVAIICERNGTIKQRATKIEVPHSAEALALVASSFYEEPARKLKMIGVAGSFGQCSVAYTLRHLLQQSGIKTGLVGSIHHQVGEREFPVQRISSESLDVQKLLRQMVNAGCGVCVVEINEQSLRNNRFFGIDFEMIISTRIERNFSFSADQELLEETLRQLVRNARHACVINVDDPVGYQLSQAHGAARLISYGIEERAQIAASGIQLFASGSRFELQIGNEIHSCGIPHVGRRSILSAVGAVAGALTAGVPFDRIESKLADLPGIPGHLEAVSCGQSFSVFVDHANNEEEFASVLQTLREVCRRRLIVAFGCEGERHEEKRYTMGRIAANAADYTIITADNSRNEPVRDIIAEIEQGYLAIRQNHYEICVDRAAAITQAIALARPGDCVLIAGKGHNTYQEFEDAISPFDDREYASEALAIKCALTPQSETSGAALANV